MFATSATTTYLLVTGRLVTRIIGNVPAMTMAEYADPRRYMQLAATLRAQIANGTYVRDARIPSIRALCEDYKLSRQNRSYLRPCEGIAVNLTQTQQNQIKRARQAIDRDIFLEAIAAPDSFAMSRFYGEALGEARHDVRALLDIIDQLAPQA